MWCKSLRFENSWASDWNDLVNWHGNATSARYCLSTNESLGWQGKIIRWGSWKNLQSSKNKIYSTISENKVAFAERTVRSLKNLLYRYMGDYEYNYLHKLTKLATTLKFRKKIDQKVWYQRWWKISGLCPFRAASHYENKENPRKQWEIEFASPNFQEVLWATVHLGSFWNFRKFLQNAPNIHNKRWREWNFAW